MEREPKLMTRAGVVQRVVATLALVVALGAVGSTFLSFGALDSVGCGAPILGSKVEHRAPTSSFLYSREGPVCTRNGHSRLAIAGVVAVLALVVGVGGWVRPLGLPWWLTGEDPPSRVRRRMEGGGGGLSGPVAGADDTAQTSVRLPSAPLTASSSPSASSTPSVGGQARPAPGRPATAAPRPGASRPATASPGPVKRGPAKAVPKVAPGEGAGRAKRGPEKATPGPVKRGAAKGTPDQGNFDAAPGARAGPIKRGAKAAPDPANPSVAKAAPGRWVSLRDKASPAPGPGPVKQAPKEPRRDER